VTIALAGNQNSGKTTLFNRLTGSNQRVGNFPGVTVERKSGALNGYSGISVIDLPGVYSLSAHSNEEVVTSSFLRGEAGDKPRAIINIVDATSIERNLYLTLQLMQLKIPMIIALNMMDEVYANGGEIDTAGLSDVLGVAVVPISAAKKQGLAELAEKAVQIAEISAKPTPLDFGHTSQDLLIEKRYDFISAICSSYVKKPAQSRQYRQSGCIDSIITHRIFAIPVFLMIMLAIFYLTFSVIGTPLSNLTKTGISALGGLLDTRLTAYGINEILHSLIIDGIFAGIGVILAFIPVIITLFFFLSLLEDSGYMARVAFIMDRPLRKISLSGKSIVPMLLGFGCTVPAVMATRTLACCRDRKTTILLTPFMSCSAKIPVYALFIAVFFPKHQVLMMMSLYLTGIMLGILSAYVIKKTVYKGEPAPYILELPNYRIPSAQNTRKLLYDRLKDFIQRAFTVILAAVVIIWFLRSFDPRLNFTQAAGDSMLAVIGKSLSVIFTPLGFDDWRISTSLITGFIAKEAVIGTLSVLSDSSEPLGVSLTDYFTPLSAYAFLIFTLLYTPCIAAVTAIRRELGSAGGTVLIILFQTVFAWLIAFLVYRIGV
jgi:ferrous iron transport protein B